jgi:hypothetical protein
MNDGQDMLLEWKKIGLQRESSLVTLEVQEEEEDRKLYGRTEWTMIAKPSEYGTGRVLP